MVNTSQQLGGAIGTALLNTIAASAMASYITDHIATAATKPQQQLVQLQGMVHGYANAAWVAVGIVAGAAVIALALINVGRPKADSSTGEGLEAQVPVIAH
jgi:uncharacterized protein YktB (UPF0637 family)